MIFTSQGWNLEMTDLRIYRGLFVWVRWYWQCTSQSSNGERAWWPDQKVDPLTIGAQFLVRCTCSSVLDSFALFTLSTSFWKADPWRISIALSAPSELPNWTVAEPLALPPESVCISIEVKSSRFFFLRNWMRLSREAFLPRPAIWIDRRSVTTVPREMFTGKPYSLLS